MGGFLEVDGHRTPLGVSYGSLFQPKGSCVRFAFTVVRIVLSRENSWIGRAFYDKHLVMFLEILSYHKHNCEVYKTLLGAFRLFQFTEQKNEM